MSKKKPKVNPWRAARARVWRTPDGWWIYEVTDRRGRVVDRDMAGGGIKGFLTTVRQAHANVWVVRQMDGRGQKLKRVS